MGDDARIIVRDIEAGEIRDRIEEFGRLLHTCVHAGASINFILPFEPSDAEAFWRDSVLPDVASGRRIVQAAEKAGHIIGSVQLAIAMAPNQPHRADVNKLMVHPDHRRRGIARLLMACIEARAGELGRTLITLDTRTGDSAEPLYMSLGYQIVGVIPGYCRNPFVDRLDSTTVMYKAL